MRGAACRRVTVPLFPDRGCLRLSLAARAPLLGGPPDVRRALFSGGRLPDDVELCPEVWTHQLANIGAKFPSTGKGL